MSEEVRFFLRTALYTGLIATIYWFVSYEWAGTVLLAALFGSAVFFVAIVSVLARVTPSDGQETSRGVRHLIHTVVGFEEPGDEASRSPLEIAEDVFPTGSIWPLVLAIAVTLLALGLVYGPWLWIPGAGLGLTAGLNWLFELKTG